MILLHLIVARNKMKICDWLEGIGNSKNCQNFPIFVKMLAEIHFDSNRNGCFRLFFLMNSSFQCDNAHN